MIAAKTTQVTFRVDKNLKKKAQVLFDEMGIDMTTALTAFIKAAVREGRMPFALTGDDFAFRQMVREKLESSLAEASKPDARWLSQEEVFGKFKDKYGYEVQNQVQT